MMFTMVLNLLTTRFVLAALGIEDMGVYGVVGSIVSMFTVLVSGLYSVTQRFITFEIGKTGGDVSKVFSTATNIILLASVVLFIVLEIGGCLMLEYSVKIPEISISTARIVLQFSILTCVVSVNATSYNALILANEKMDAWAVISIVQVVLNCLSAYCLVFIAKNERLLWYSVIVFGVQILTRGLHICYCKFKFRDVRWQWHIDGAVAKEMVMFAGGTYFNSILQMVSAQGLVLIVNWIFGVAINAVYNIGLQVKNSVLSFGMNVFKAVSPQITKTYAGGEIETHKKLVFSGSKLGAFMILLVLIPFVFKSSYIMRLWLGTVPQYTESFAVAFVFQSLLYAGFEPFRTAVLATGNVSKFYVYSEIFHLIVLPLSYFAARCFNSPIPFVIVVVVCEFAYCGCMLYFGTRVTVFTVRSFLKNTAFPCCFVLTCSSLVSYFVSGLFSDSIIGLFGFIIVCGIVTAFFVWFVGLNEMEKSLCKSVVNKFLKR